MLSLNEKFLIGSYKKVFLVKSQRGNPVETLFKLMLENGLIDGVLTCSEKKGKATPSLFLKANQVKVNPLNSYFGINTLLKRALQKYRLNKLVVFAPPCVFDELNKTQYFGIGSNWTKTAVALKVGLLCTGALTENSRQLEAIHLTGKKEKVKRFFYDRANLVYQLESNREIIVPVNVHHKYILTACRYCLNMGAKGTDITYVPKKEPNEGLFIVRSERGWYTIAQVQKIAPADLKLRISEKEETEELVSLLRDKSLLNVNDILERVELGLPTPKWSDNKLRKFYRAWNSIEGNFEEEVF
ncbi:coenzyme F420-reducing hydrogenase beta subunit [Thermovibrio guaymasensis]|uniref:Coenzyme F420-reducing hydrogenase beta subunit n=1 Tax=Thermovibrio guaymasensis TaxID=240167 RepID=A0A420W9I2_9BACT|nr:Coenzyme F420 hydrogenase/dehydrogenase, beta subunit C-terminal domain [Thermovibrio guaymasensis]RKQ63993.1 coenzyme F420-reducing hydrogenase beta subunit [Thermovibrio guaymasensis]